MIPPWYGGAEIGKTPMASAVSTSFYLIKLNSLYLGTVLTLRRGTNESRVPSLSFTNEERWITADSFVLAHGYRLG